MLRTPVGLALTGVVLGGAVCAVVGAYIAWRETSRAISDAIDSVWR